MCSRLPFFGLLRFIAGIGLFGLFCSQIAWAVPCDVEGLLDPMQSHREAVMSELRKPVLASQLGQKSFVIKGVRYETVILLGTSNAQVYLATDPNGRQVIVKNYIHNERDIDLDDRYRLIIRESLAIQFLLEKGFEVPKILVIDLENGFVVKEYMEGLLANEVHTFAQLLGLSKQDLNKIDQKFQAERSQITSFNRTREFSRWILDGGVETLPAILREKMYLRANLANKIDGEVRNFIYSVKKSKWILFDP